MKSGNHRILGSLWANLALHSPATKTDRDVFQRRCDCEGIRFLTIDLPALGKDLDRALIVGEPFVLTARFGKQKDSLLPAFLYNIFSKIFTDSGIIRPDASPHHIKWGRQLTLMFYKLEVPHDEATLEAAYAAFCDRDIALDSSLFDVESSSEILERAAARIRGVLSSRKDCTRELVPRHGSGATACRTRPWDKYHRVPRFIQKLNDVFDYSETFFVSASHLCDELKKLTHGPTLDQPVARLSAVPKDSRGPRLICMEPREMMYVQQGLMRMIYQIVEDHPVTRGRVNFTDQSVNKNLAQRASISMEYATLDLKDASDRVRWDVVASLLPFDWVKALNACRTEYIEFPNGYTFGPLEKFAPMGSAVCFPIESLVFWALLSGNICTDVYVYGDDIILPTQHVNAAIALLEKFDLKVNLEKTCYKTHFRESCGGEFYKGHDVGYVKCRKFVERNIDSHLSFVGFVNEIIEVYGDSVAARLMSFGDNFYYPHVRTVYSNLPLSYKCNLMACNDVLFKRRWNKQLQKYEYRVPIVKARTRKLRSNPKYHWCELLRVLLTGSLPYDLGKPSRIGEYADGTCIVKDAWRGDL